MKIHTLNTTGLVLEMAKRGTVGPTAGEPGEHKGKRRVQMQVKAISQTCTLAAALTAIPSDDWCRTWPADRTVMLRMTSKEMRDAVDKLRPPAVVRLSRTFCNDPRNGTAADSLQHVLIRLALLPVRCRITTLSIYGCCIPAQQVDLLAGVLAKCPTISRLDLFNNRIDAEGARTRVE